MSEPLAPPDAVLRDVLRSQPVIAVVGASVRRERPSHGVMADLLATGYDVIPVHPTYREVLGRKCYPDLASIPGKVDVVDVFRRAEATPDVARAAVAKGARVLWLQLGIVSWEAHRIASAAGLIVVMDHCLAVEHHRLMS